MEGAGGGAMCAWERSFGRRGLLGSWGLEVCEPTCLSCISISLFSILRAMIICSDSASRCTAEVNKWLSTLRTRRAMHWPRGESRRHRQAQQQHPKAEGSRRAAVEASRMREAKTRERPGHAATCGGLVRGLVPGGTHSRGARAFVGWSFCTTNFLFEPWRRWPTLSLRMSSFIADSMSGIVDVQCGSLKRSLCASLSRSNRAWGW